MGKHCYKGDGLHSSNPLDLIADAIPDFTFPTQWVFKHLFAIFPKMIMLQITIHLKQLIEYEMKESTSEEAKTDMWLHEIVTLLPAFWVALDLYRHSVGTKNPCRFARVFAWLYCTLVPMFIIWGSVELLKKWSTPNYETRANTEHEIEQWVKFVAWLPSILTSFVYLFRIRNHK